MSQNLVFPVPRSHERDAPCLSILNVTRLCRKIMPTFFHIEELLSALLEPSAFQHIFAPKLLLLLPTTHTLQQWQTRWRQRSPLTRLGI